MATMHRCFALPLEEQQYIHVATKITLQSDVTPSSIIISFRKDTLNKDTLWWWPWKKRG